MIECGSDVGVVGAWHWQAEGIHSSESLFQCIQKIRYKQAGGVMGRESDQAWRVATLASRDSRGFGLGGRLAVVEALSTDPEEPCDPGACEYE